MELDTHIRVKAIIEIIGKPKEHVEKKRDEYLEKIKEDENLMVISEKASSVRKQDDIWSTFTELELVVKGTSNLVGFCIDYMPSSIEVIKPETFNFPERTFTEFINDLLAKLHTVDMIAKQLGAENRILKENMGKVLRNIILILLQIKVNTAPLIASRSGIAEEEVKRYLILLKEEGRVEEKDGKYTIKKNQ